MPFINRLAPYLRLARAYFGRVPTLPQSKTIALSSLTTSPYNAYRKVGLGIPLLIGRSVEDDIDFQVKPETDEVAWRHISKRHLLFWWEPSGWLVRDISGTNTTLNGVLLKGKGWQTVEFGDLFLFDGGVELKFDLTDEVPAQFRRSGEDRQVGQDIIPSVADLHLIWPREGDTYFLLKDPGTPGENGTAIYPAIET